ncbi:MAG: tetratricopeptide repeat protein [Myxococcota bacterium]|nr:tetratricopeptide repeat protein [Myxococcota bacterium]
MMEPQGEGTGAQEGEASGSLPKAWPLLAFLGLGLLCLWIYRGALEGAFVSDDFGYIVSHPYTEALDLETVRAVFDPFGPAKLYAANYAPVHLLLTALERQIFADAPLGYHLVNVAVHAANATLLVLLFVASGVGPLAALVGGLLFAVHPANVEAVAWASQLKTNASLLFSLLALLAFRRHPGWATPLFVLGLLTKASAAVALPTAAAFAWAWGASEPERNRERWIWLGLWLLLFVAYAIPQAGSFAHQGAVEVAAFDDRWVHLRTVAAVGARYLVMAASSWGVSAFQEPEPAFSWLHPWWLLALPAAAVLSARLFVTLRDRRVEAAWWVFAAASFAPVSQVFPFLNPVADRYLYFILPGLLGGLLCAWTPWSRGLPATAQRVAGGLALAIAVFFGLHAAARAELWRGETWLLLDAAKHYPEGSVASFLRARRAAQEGDAATAMAELRRATEFDIDSFLVLQKDRALAPLRGDPAFQQLVNDVAGRWIERSRRRGVESQAELRMLGLAHLQRRELDEALASYERALELGGPLDPTIRIELEAVRAERDRIGAGEDGHSAPRS